MCPMLNRAGECLLFPIPVKVKDKLGNVMSP